MEPSALIETVESLRKSTDLGIVRSRSLYDDGDFKAKLGSLPELSPAVVNNAFTAAALHFIEKDSETLHSLLVLLDLSIAAFCAKPELKHVPMDLFFIMINTTTVRFITEELAPVLFATRFKLMVLNQDQDGRYKPGSSLMRSGNVLLTKGRILNHLESQERFSGELRNKIFQELKLNDKILSGNSSFTKVPWKGPTENFYGKLRTREEPVAGGDFLAAKQTFADPVGYLSETRQGARTTQTAYGRVSDSTSHKLAYAVSKALKPLERELVSSPVFRCTDQLNAKAVLAQMQSPHVRDAFLVQTYFFSHFFSEVYKPGVFYRCGALPEMKARFFGNLKETIAGSHLRSVREACEIESEWNDWKNAGFTPAEVGQTPEWKPIERLATRATYGSQYGDMAVTSVWKTETGIGLLKRNRTQQEEDQIEDYKMELYGLRNEGTQDAVNNAQWRALRLAKRNGKWTRLGTTNLADGIDAL